MKKVLVAVTSLVLCMTTEIVSAMDFQSATTVDYSVVIADVDASTNAFIDGDDEKDKKKSSKCCQKSKKCCRSKGADKDSKCAGASKKCCDTTKSCDRSKTATEVKGQDDK